MALVIMRSGQMGGALFRSNLALAAVLPTPIHASTGTFDPYCAGYSFPFLKRVSIQANSVFFPFFKFYYKSTFAVNQGINHLKVVLRVKQIA